MADDKVNDSVDVGSKLNEEKDASTTGPSTSEDNDALATDNGLVDGAATQPTPKPSEIPVEPADAASVAPSKEAPAPPTPRSPAPRRPDPPTKGILKPPPPPSRPTLSNRLRDIAGVAKSLFDPLEDPAQSSTPSGSGTGSSSGSGLRTQPNGHNGGQSSTSASSSSGDAYSNGIPPAVSSAFTAFSGRLGAGFNRLVVAASQGSPASSSSPQGSPMGSRSISLPDGVAPLLQSERARQKQPLKRATFVLPSMSITYPISSQGEPWSQKVVADREKIESEHMSLLSAATGAEYWTNEKLVMLYERACRVHCERPRVAIVRALEMLPTPPRPRHLHFAVTKPERPTPPSQPSPQPLEVPLNRDAAEALADLLAVEWGLTDLRLENGTFESDDCLKAILHALLISGTLSSLSLAGNKRLKAPAWRLLAVFMKKAKSLRFLDVSDTSWDKKGIDYMVQALTCTPVTPTSAASAPGSSVGQANGHTATSMPGNVGSPTETEMKREESRTSTSFVRPAPLLREVDGPEAPSALQTLRMDGCALRPNSLEALAIGVRSSDIKNISLRRNKIGPLGGVALAIMIRDYPDASLSMSSLSPALTSSNSGISPSPSLLSLDQTATQSNTPYTPRSRRTLPDPSASDPSLPPIPTVTSSAAGGITSRTIPDGYKSQHQQQQQPTQQRIGSLLGLEGGVNMTSVEGRMSSSDAGGASIALQRSVRALDGVERIGRLLTLDLKGNEIKNGVAYIAQVLKRNRTLKVLNLSDNKIEAPGLTALAEALKYNSSLETLDISSNPCCGPSMEGVSALRNTFTVNTSLKRLFLADTGLTTDGAISLAEFLPETKSLLHLDLTSNPLIETAGILALSVGLKSNTLIRCLDLSIPPNSPNLAELSQSILQSCIRNTELAADTAKPGPGQEAVWQPIKKSTLVQGVKAADRARQDKEREDIAKSSEGQAREFVYTLKPERLVSKSEDVIRDLERWFEAGRLYHMPRTAKHPGFNGVWEPNQLPKTDYDVLYERAKILRERIVDRIQEDPDAQEMESLLAVNDSLSTVLETGVKFQPPPRLLLPSQIVYTAHAPNIEADYRSNHGSPSRPPPLRNGSNGSNGSFTGGGGQGRGQAPIPRAVRRHMRIPSLEISSPNFSIGDSDNDSDADAEEVDVGSFEQSPPKLEGLLGADTLDTAAGSVTTATAVTTGTATGSSTTGGADEDLLGVEPAGEMVHSPTERVSRAWVEEEGEIFRKGTKLGVAEAEEDDEEGEGDVSGEQLKQEILETHVERSPIRQLVGSDEDETDEGTEGDSPVTKLDAKA